MRHAVSLPSDEELERAMMASPDLVIAVEGQELLTYSTSLEQRSSSFKQRLAALRAGQKDTGLSEEGSRLRLRLSEYSLQAVQALLSFLQSGARTSIRELSPATMKELAFIAEELELDDLLQLLDGVLAGQLQQDMVRSADTDIRSWQYNGGHVRERGVQMLQLALKLGLERLQRQAELFVAANWAFFPAERLVSSDVPKATQLRIKQLANSMSSAPYNYSSILPGGKFMAWGAQQMAAGSQAMANPPPQRAFPAYILPMS